MREPEAGGGPADPVGAARRWTPWLLAIATGLVAFVLLSQANPDPPITDDGARDLLLARDCAELSKCHPVGAATSVPGFYQGAAWLDLLVAIRLLGGDTLAARTVVLVLDALAVATLFVVTWRWVRPSLALAASALVTAMLLPGAIVSQLINPSAVIFPDILGTGALFAYALSGQRRFLIAGSFALAVAINFHLASLALLPSLIALAALTSARPLRNVALAFGVVVLTTVSTSWDSWIGNTAGMFHHHQLVPAILALAVSAGVAAPFGTRFRALSLERRMWVVGLLLVGPFALGSLWLLFLQHHEFGITYWHPVLGPGAVLVAAAVRAPVASAVRAKPSLRWLPVATLYGFLLVAGLWEAPTLKQALHAGAGMWTAADARAIAEVLMAKHWTQEQILLHLQTSGCRELAVGTSVYTPAPDGTPINPARQLRVWRAPIETALKVASEADVLPLRNGRAVVMKEIVSWLRPGSLKVCHVPTDTTVAPECAQAPDRIVSESVGLDRFTFGSRSHPHIHELDRPSPYVARYEIPLVPLAGQSRRIEILDSAPQGCRWHVTRAEGLHVDSPLPAEQVLLRSEAGLQGTLVIEKAYGTHDCPYENREPRYPPCFMETGPEEANLRAALEP